MIRLKNFSYFEPRSVAEATRILAENGTGAFPLAGGTDLLVRMKRGNINPSVLVNLKHIDALDDIRNGEGLHIGALTTISAIEQSPVIHRRHAVLAQAAGLLGARQIRNLATIGGNIGRASPASDMSPALVVLQARALVEGPAGRRELEIENFFTGPGATRLEPGEIITAFTLPEPPPDTGAAYLKLGRRSGGGDCALVGVAALVSLGDNGAVDVRIAMSSVGPRPLRASQAEQMMTSGPFTEDRMHEAAHAAAEEATPISDMRCSASYRKEMVRVLTYRALQEAHRKAQGGIHP